MKSNSICCDGHGDHITWVGKKKVGEVEVSDRYYNLCTQELHITKVCWFYKFWRTMLPTKIIMFLWLVWKNKNLTWDNLLNRKWQGPRIF